MIIFLQSTAPTFLLYRPYFPILPPLLSYSIAPLSYSSAPTFLVLSPAYFPGLWLYGHHFPTQVSSFLQSTTTTFLVYRPSFPTVYPPPTFLQSTLLS